MSVRKEEYIVIGCKLSENFTTDLWNRKDRHELDDKFNWEKERENEIQYLTDGMNGDYTFFGYLKQISDGWDESNCDEIEFTLPTEEQCTKIKNLFSELFPDEQMPKITMYYLPHYC